MPTRTLSRETDLLKKALEPKALKRLEKSGYLIKDPGVKDTRRAKIPPERKVQTRKEIADTLATWYGASGLEKKRLPKTPVAEPDMHDGGKRLPKFRVKALVRDLDIIRGGTFLQFNFKTTVPCVPLIVASHGPLDVMKVDTTGEYRIVGEPEYASLLQTFFSGHQTTHSIALTDLEPRSVNKDPYNYVIMLKPKEDGHPWEPTTGSDKTLRRHVVVTVDRVHVRDAADFAGTGEMYFKSQIGHLWSNFKVAGNSLDHAIHPPTNDEGGAGEGHMYVSSGDVVPLNFRLLAKGASRGVEHAFSAVERDAGSIWPGSASPFGTNRGEDIYEGTYDIDHLEAASDQWKINVDKGTFMSGNRGDPLWQREEYSVDFAREVNGSPTTDLRYFIYGKIRVLYAF